MKELSKEEKAYIRKILRDNRKRKRKERLHFLFHLTKMLFSFDKEKITKSIHNIKDGFISSFVYKRYYMKPMRDIKKTPVKKQKVKKIKRKIEKKIKRQKTNGIKKHSVKNKKHHLKPKRKKREKKKVFSLIKWLLLTGIILFLIAGTAFFFWFSSLELPSVDNFQKRKIVNSTKIYDRTGKILLYDIHKDIRRTVVSSDKISRHAKNAIIAIEDHNFYQHHGVMWKSTLRAAFQTLLAKLGFPHSEISGGSTLTQQVVKNTLLNRKKTITRKVKEWVLAYKLEKKMSKDEILTTYLNEAPYGGTIYGIQEASMVYFGKPASDLTIAESAYLAAIPNLPTYYSPYGKHRDELDQRQRLVLSKMREYGFINPSEYQQALMEKVQFLPREVSGAKAMHFVQYVRSLLEKRYGEDMVENGGLSVITTIDYQLQKKAEDIIKKHVEEVEEEDASNAALVALESSTGDIITMVGSRDYFDTEEFDGNFNVALSPRQPGSSFKPIAYATAFEKGFFPETAIFDVQTQFNARCEKDYFTTGGTKHCYSPSNWDNKFKGPLTFRTALAQSRNVPAVKVMYLAGLPNVMKKAREMGITSLTQAPSFYGLGLVLGGGDVSLLEMVSAYDTFSQEGVHVKPRAILEVKDHDGNVIYKNEVKKDRVFSENIARMVSSILSDNVARTPLYGAHSHIYFGEGIDVAGKTGTTNDKRDAWMIGYTTDVVVGVWTGNNNNMPMKKGSKLSMKPWRQYMDEALKVYPPGHFSDYELPENFDELKPILRGEWEGNTSFVINKLNGKLATDDTPEDLRKVIRVFDPHTILHYVNKNNPQGDGDGRSDGQYPAWEYGVQNYVHEHYEDRFEENPQIPEEEDDGDVRIPEILIDGLEDTYSPNNVVDLEFDIDGMSRDHIQKVMYYLDGIYLGTSSRKQFNILFDLSDVPNLSEGNHLLKVEVVTDKNIHFSKEFPLEVKND